MGLEQNKSVVRRFIEEVWNQRRLELADDIFAPGCITHQLRSGSELTMERGPEEIKQHIEEWLKSFPDLEFTIEQMIAEAECVTTLCVAKGRHRGYWLGIAPTGKSITIQMSVIHRFSEGRIVEDWVLVESLGLYQQLGIVRPTEEIIAKASGQSTTED